MTASIESFPSHGPHSPLFISLNIYIISTIPTPFLKICYSLVVPVFVTILTSFYVSPFSFSILFSFLLPCTSIFQRSSIGPVKTWWHVRRSDGRLFSNHVCAFCRVVRGITNTLSLLQLQISLGLKVPLVQIGSAWEWYRWIGLEKKINCCRVFIFYFLLEYLIRVQSSEPFHAKMNSTSCFFGSRLVCAQTAIFSAEPCQTYAWETSIVLWITAPIQTKIEQHFDRFFHQIKVWQPIGRILCKPWSEQAGGWIHFCMKHLRTLKSIQIFKSEIEKSKTYSGWCPFQGLFNGTTLM